MNMKKKNNGKIKVWHKMLCLLHIGAFSFLPVMADEIIQTPFSKEIRQKINPDMNDFIFKLDGYEEGHGDCYTKTITIIDAKTGKKIQTIDTKEFNDGDYAQSPSSDLTEIIIEDLDFDNFADIRINAFLTAGANRLFICWLWDTKKKQFVYDSPLSEVINLEVYSEDKSLYSFARVDAATHRIEILKFINNKLTVVEVSESHSEYNDDGTITTEVVTRELKNGQLVETGREKRNENESEENLPEEQQKNVNLLDTISDNDWKALNIFFSNFSETHFEDFNYKKYNDKALIDFAMHHIVINNRNYFEGDSVDKKYINATIKKYFGIDKITPQSIEDGFVLYKDGKYYWEDVTEGFPKFDGAQVIEFYDNQDGTFLAIIEDYKDNQEYHKGGSPDNFGASFYPPKKSWSPSVAKKCSIAGYHVAKVAPHTYNNKKTYKLLEWYKAKSLEAVRAKYPLP